MNAETSPYVSAGTTDGIADALLLVRRYGTTAVHAGGRASRAAEIANEKTGCFGSPTFFRT